MLLMFLRYLPQIPVLGCGFTPSIQMLDDGVVLISKTVDVYDLLDSDDFERIQDLVESGDVDQYDANDGSPEISIKKHRRIEG